MSHNITYTVDGVAYDGTIEDYANALKMSHYNGVEVSSVVTLTTREHLTAHITTSEYDYDSDYAYVTVDVKGFKAAYVIDGRA